MEENGLKLIMSDSKLLSPAQTKFSAVEREYLGIKFLLTRAEAYLRQCECKCLLLSDAQSITYLIRTKNSKPSHLAFASFLSTFDNLELQYLPG